MRDTTIAAALSKHVDPRYFPVGSVLHEFDQGNYDHKKKLSVVHHLNCMRKLHDAVQKAKTLEELKEIMDRQLYHINEVGLLFGV